MKKTYLISYDLSEKGNYEDLLKAIKAYKTWAHITESLWAIKTDQSASDIRENIEQYFPNGGRIFILKSGTEAAWKNVICRNEWLKDNL